MPDHIIRPAMPDTCGNCKFGQTVVDDFKIVECHGAPPTPAIMGMGAQGPAVGLLRARLPRVEKACALWKLRLETLANDPGVLEGQRV